MGTITADVLADDQVMLESPRWRDGRLLFCDWGAGTVLAVDPDGGEPQSLAGGLTLPFCLEHLDDGRLLIVDGRAGRVLRRERDGTLVEHASLDGVAAPPFNEIVRAPGGALYVNYSGFVLGMEDFRPGGIALVDADGAARVVAEDLAFPNGMAVTADGGTLLVAESYAGRITAFAIEPGGALGARRVWAAVAGSAPDGLCVDAEGAAWYADVPNRCCVRVAEGGAVLDRVEADRGCFSCALGGEDGRTLFICAAEWPLAMTAGTRSGRVLAARVDVPAA